MNKLALDIVLLPPEEVMRKAIALNTELLKQVDSDYRQNTKDRLPHITLTMGIVNEEDLKKIFADIDDIAQNFKPLSLVASEIEIYESPNRIMSGLKIEKTEDLLNIHTEAVKKIKDKYFSYDARPKYFLQPPTMTSAGEYWKRKGPEIDILENYNPHITLGYGKVSLDEPFQFQVQTLAVCHLGKDSTCRKILYSVVLSSKE